MKERRHLEDEAAKSPQVIVIINRSGESETISLSSRLDEEIERAHRYQHFLSLIVLAVELSPTEKESLEQIIRLLRKNTRKVDILSSYEEGKFTLLLPETSREGALSLAWRLKKELESYNLLAEAKTNNKAHIGVACYPTEASSGEELLEKAFLSLKEKEDDISWRRKDSCEQNPVLES